MPEPDEFVCWECCRRVTQTQITVATLDGLGVTDVTLTLYSTETYWPWSSLAVSRCPECERKAEA